MKQFLINNSSIITSLVEIIAALSGTIYIRITKNEKLRVFVYYLWLIVVVETIGKYSYLMQNNYDYDWFISLKNSVFCRNHWLYNIYLFLAIGLLGIFYSDLLSNKFYKLIIRSITIFFIVFSFVYFTFTDAFFLMGLPYEGILASIIVSVFVILYFVELISSEYILEYYKLPSFYISVALLLWNICVTPLFIFNEYFRAVNTYFVDFRGLVLLIINIFTYLCYAFGFWYSLKRSRQ